MTGEMCDNNDPELNEPARPAAARPVSQVLRRALGERGAEKPEIGVHDRFCRGSHGG